MSRLPKVGSDDGVWGQLLNDYLSIEHNADGTLKLRTDNNFYNKPSGGIPKTDLDADVQATLGVATAAIADATTTARGRVQLSGDLAGSATSPLVKSRTVTKTVGPAGAATDYVCDGTGDHIELQQALDAVAALNGGTVMVKSGNYSIGAKLRVGTNVHLIGEDDQNVIFTLVDNVNDTVIENTDLANGNANIWVQNITINANGVNQTIPGYGIHLRECSNALIERVHISNTRGHGMLLDGESDSDLNSQHITIRHCSISNTVLSTANGMFIYRSSYITVSQCAISNNGQYGFYIQTSDHIIVDDTTASNNKEGIVLWTTQNSTLQNCTAQSNSATGIRLDGGSHRNTTTNCRAISNGAYGIMGGVSVGPQNEYNSYINNLVEGNGDDALVIDHSNYAIVMGNIVRRNGSHAGDQGLPIDTSVHCVISGNKVEENRADGIEVKNASHYCTITGNVVKNNSNPAVGGIGDGRGITIRDGIMGCTVTGNTVFDDQATTSQRYGIEITGTGPDYNTVVGNTVFGNTLGQIRLASTIGTHNAVYGNAGGEQGRVNDQPLTINNSSTSNAIEIVQTGNVGASETTKGALHITNTGNAGVGFGMYTNYAGGAVAALMEARNNNLAWDYDVAIADFSNYTTQNAMRITQFSPVGVSRAAMVIESDVDNSTANAYGLLALRQNNAASANRALWIDHAGTGEAMQIRAAQGKGMFLDNNGNGISIDIDHDGNSSSAITGLRIFADNAGTGAAYAAIFGSGRVGIGTVTPTVELEVNGTVKANLFQGSISSAAGLKSATTTVAVDSATAPTAGQVLTATSTTAAQWQTPAALSTLQNWCATDQGLLGWSYDVALATLTQIMPSAGVLHLARLNVYAGTLTNVHLDVATIGAGLTSAGVAVYQNGTLLGQSADISSSLLTTNGKTIPLSAPVTVSAGYIYVAIWANGTTLPTLTRAVQRSNANVGLNSTNYRFASSGSGITTTAPGTLGTLAASSTSWWFGVS